MKLKQKLYCNTLGCKMAYAVKGIMRRLAARFASQDVDLTLEQYFILNILDNEEGLILQDLANIVDRDKSAVLRHIDGLEEHCFVVRTTDANDKRRKILIVTKPGLKELEKARKLEEKVHQEITGHLKGEKLKEFEEILSKIYKKTLSIGNG